ncbi:hypothetical protein K6W98_18690 [Burkholderia cepacia]|nr:hypothetical protein [Burkholderia cepacia]MBY4736110.1 hypothetical protein [Burkholderia cepacia]MBY4746587.1 hypothetical protein [Burkholderia cepacia]MBY4758769.1 hypothetical protein [Burkholderia cepacia]MBY4776817.1 hypothetical protein [Burkholderia cepacia]
MVPIVSQFQQLHSDVTVELHLSDAVADLLDGGWDLAVRFGERPDSSLVARPPAGTARPRFRGTPSRIAHVRPESGRRGVSAS